MLQTRYFFRTDTRNFVLMLSPAQRYRNAQIAMMKNPGPRQKMELQIAEQAFRTAHTLSLQFEHNSRTPTSTATTPRGTGRADSGYDTDGSNSVSSVNSARSAGHPYARKLSKRERNKLSATKVGSVVSPPC
jgi:hypothetical protein